MSTSKETALRKSIRVFCDHCGEEFSEKFRESRNGHETAWLAWWCDQPEAYERITFDGCALLCRPCHLELVRKRPRSAYFSDGPIDWFTGLRAFPKYIDITGHYGWTNEALKQLQAAMVQLQCLPTGEDIPW